MDLELGPSHLNHETCFLKTLFAIVLVRVRGYSLFNRLRFKKYVSCVVVLIMMPYILKLMGCLEKKIKYLKNKT